MFSFRQKTGEMTVFISPLSCHVWTGNQLLFWFNFHSNVKVQKSVMVPVLSLYYLLSICLCLFSLFQCVQQNFSDPVIPHFSTNHFSSELLPLPISWLVTGLYICPQLVIYTCSSKAALTFFFSSFSSFIYIIILP